MNRPGSVWVGKLETPTMGSVEQVGDHEVGARGAHVDGDDAALARVDVEELGLAAARGLALGAFEEDALGDEVVDDEADGAAAGAHEAGEVGAGDGLPGADEVEEDLAVDLAGGAAAGDANRARAG